MSTPTRKLKPTIDASEKTRQREMEAAQIRKKNKDEILQKRRKDGGISDSKMDDNLREKMANLKQLAESLRSMDVNVQMEATVSFRKLLSMERNPPIDQVIETGVVPIFVQFLTRVDQPHLQFEAAWALTNIASGTTDHTKLVIDAGSVPIFVQLLASPVEEVREQSVWALGNIAGDSFVFRNIVLQSLVMVPLVNLINSNPKLTMLRNATWTMSNLCRGKPIPDFELVRPALPTLAQLLHHTDDEVLTDACWAISYISDGPNDRIQAVVDAGICRRLVELLMYHQPSVQTPALRTVGNIVTGDDHQTQAVINCGALNCLASLLSHPKKSIRKEACWTISNVTAGNQEQIQCIIDANLIPPLLSLLSIGEFDVKKEAAWAISNATSGGNVNQIRYLVQLGCIKPLCDLLPSKDAKVVNVALEGIENILKSGQYLAAERDGINPYLEYVEEADGVDYLEDLQDHQNSEIYDKAVHIIERYFGLEDESDMGAQQGAGQFHFGQSVQPPHGGFNFGPQ